MNARHVRRTEALLLTAMTITLTVVLGSCAQTDLTPVSRSATGPWACSGVPRTGAQLALGISDLPARDVAASGSWGDWQFSCTTDVDGYALNVTQQPATDTPLGDSADTVIESIRTQAEGLPTFTGPIEAEAPGVGYVTQVDEPVVIWVCNEFVTRLRFYGEPPNGRDPIEDAVNLLVSMLPWACGEEPPPVDGADA